MHRTTVSAFCDELRKIAADKKKRRKISGEITVDQDNAMSTLESAQARPSRGPHPALNYEHSR